MAELNKSLVYGKGMDINIITIFPSAFLGKVSKDPIIGSYFLNINQGRYAHHMSDMMQLLLGAKEADTDTIHHLYTLCS